MHPSFGTLWVKNIASLRKDGAQMKFLKESNWSWLSPYHFASICPSIWTFYMQKNPRQDQTAVGTTNPNWICVPNESNNVAAYRNCPCDLFP